MHDVRSVLVGNPTCPKCHFPHPLGMRCHEPASLGIREWVEETRLQNETNARLDAEYGPRAKPADGGKG